MAAISTSTPAAATEAPGGVFYAVLNGRVPGVYTTWSAAAPQVTHFRNARHRLFRSHIEAALWLRKNGGGNAALAAAGARPPAVPLKLAFKQQQRRSAADADAVPGEVVVYCDGAASDARAGVGVFFGVGDARNVSERLSASSYRQTAEVAEIMAAYVAVAAVAPTVPLRVRTASKYVVVGMTEWRPRWKREQWRSTALVNRDLWRRLSEAVDARAAQTRFEHVRVPSDAPSDEPAADATNRLATCAAALAEPSSIVDVESSK